MASLPPIKNTSGEGFTVEDRVVAFLAAHLLVGISWPDAGEGVIEVIQCQMRQDGWLFDDAILTINVDGFRRKCACSVKSHSVFGRQGAPLA